jgi:hypothetical protein
MQSASQSSPFTDVWRRCLVIRPTCSRNSLGSLPQAGLRFQSRRSTLWPRFGMLIETSNGVTLGARSYWSLKTTDTVTEESPGRGCSPGVPFWQLLSEDLGSLYASNLRVVD